MKSATPKSDNFPAEVTSLENNYRHKRILIQSQWTILAKKIEKRKNSSPQESQGTIKKESEHDDANSHCMDRKINPTWMFTIFFLEKTKFLKNKLFYWNVIVAVLHALVHRKS